MCYTMCSALFCYAVLCCAVLCYLWFYTIHTGCRYLVGEADYCMTPTVSTFAQTAIFRSNCVYVDALLGDKCTAGKSVDSHIMNE